MDAIAPYTAITIPKGFRITPEQFEQLTFAEQLARLELTESGEDVLSEFSMNLTDIFN